MKISFRKVMAVSLTIVMTLLIMPFSSAYAEYTFKSAWLRNYSSSSLIYSSNTEEYNINKYKKDHKNTFAAKFLSGLVQLGYPTNWDNGEKVFEDFQKRENLALSNGVITKEDIERLDIKLYEQEKKDVMNLTALSEAYPNTRVRLSKCSYKPMSHYLGLITETVNAFSAEQRSALEYLELRCTENGSRGLGGDGTIILQPSKMMSGNEFLGVFIHEMGHVVDSSIQSLHPSGKSNYSDLKEVIYANDPSVEFYKISFNTFNKTSKNSKRGDFVSGYALTDCHEDLAESITSYVLRGMNFKYATESNEVLNAKYNFLKNIVFDGKEFYTGEYENLVDVWDATKPNN